MHPTAMPRKPRAILRLVSSSPGGGVGVFEPCMGVLSLDGPMYHQPQPRDCDNELHAITSFLSRGVNEHILQLYYLLIKNLRLETNYMREGLNFISDALHFEILRGASEARKEMYMLVLHLSTGAGNEVKAKNPLAGRALLALERGCESI